MTQPAGLKVGFTRANAQKCLCGQCPVQAQSRCVSENARQIGDIATTNQFDPSILPGLYCSSGTASCTDIDGKQSCICGGCEVYNSHNLGSGEPTHHYCLNGSAR